MLGHITSLTRPRCHPHQLLLQEPIPSEQGKPHTFGELSQGPPCRGPTPCSLREQHQGQRQQDQDRPRQCTHSFTSLRSHILHPHRRGSLLPGIVLCHNHIGVPLGRVKPHLDAAPTAPTLCGVFVGVGPDLLTQVFWFREDFAEGPAYGAPRTAVCS